MRCFNNETRSSHELNDTKFRSKVQKVQKIYTNLIEIEKLEMREMSTRITFSLECSVFGLSVRPPKRIPRCVSRCATKAQQVRAAPPKRANARKKTYDHFSFFLSLSLSLSFSTVGRFISASVKILRGRDCIVKKQNEGTTGCINFRKLFLPRCNVRIKGTWRLIRKCPRDRASPSFL